MGCLLGIGFIALQCFSNKGFSFFPFLFLGRRKQRVKKGKRIVAQVEVVVTMMWKSSKSGIQDLEEVEKEMWMKQETPLQVL